MEKTRRLESAWKMAALASSLVCATSAAQAGDPCTSMPLPPECETIQITATLEDVNDGQDILAAVAATITGTFTFDSSVSDSVPGDTQIGEYIDSVACGSFDLGNEILDFDALDDPNAESGIFTENDITQGAGPKQTSSDFYGVVGGGPGGTPSEIGATAFSLTLADVCAVLVGGCPSNALTSDAIPATPPDPDDFLSRILTIQLSVLNGVAFVDAEPTNLTSVTPIPCPVPEPSASALAAAALASLCGIKGSPRRRRCGS